jgi:hypothetical protein
MSIPKCIIRTIFVDIIARRNDCIGRVNNMLCYFRKLSSHVKYRLFRSYCNSFYGCELWSLTSSSIEDLCIAWRRGVRLVWNLPPSAHCFILPLICNCLPVFDEICRRAFMQLFPHLSLSKSELSVIIDFICTT